MDSSKFNGTYVAFLSHSFKPSCNLSIDGSFSPKSQVGWFFLGEWGVEWSFIAALPGTAMAMLMHKDGVP